MSCIFSSLFGLFFYMGWTGWSGGPDLNRGPLIITFIKDIDTAHTRRTVHHISPALDVLLQSHHHGQVLINIWLSRCLTFTSKRIVDQLQLAFPRQDVGVSVVETKWDLCSSVGAAVATDHSDLVSQWRKQKNYPPVVN